MAKARAKPESKGATIAVNRRAGYDYDLVERFDAGIELLGTEIKSIRNHKANITEGYARFRDGELWLYNVHVAQYPPARENHDPLRPRRLLLHRRELDRLEQELREHPRSTVVPTRLYLNNGLAKIEIALGSGRRAYDKREAIAKREADRAIQRGVRREQR